MFRGNQDKRVSAFDLARRTILYYTSNIMGFAMTTSNSPSQPTPLAGTILVVGGGGHGRVIAGLAQACGYFRVDFADDRSPQAAGALSDLVTLASRFVAADVSIENLPLWQEILDRLENLSGPLPPFVLPTVVVSPSAQLAPGALVQPGAIGRPHAVVGKGTIISAGAVIDHNAVIGPCANVDAGTVVAPHDIVPPLIRIPAGDRVLPALPKGPFP